MTRWMHDPKTGENYRIPLSKAKNKLMEGLCVGRICDKIWVFNVETGIEKQIPRKMLYLYEFDGWSQGRQKKDPIPSSSSSS